jgi:hypothetical protein
MYNGRAKRSRQGFVLSQAHQAKTADIWDFAARDRLDQHVPTAGESALDGASVDFHGVCLVDHMNR